MRQRRLLIPLIIFLAIIALGFSEVFSLMRVPQAAATTVAASPLIAAATVEPSKTAAPTLTATAAAPIRFSGEAAFKHVTAQMNFGPRPAGSEANIKTGNYIKDELTKSVWQAEFQTFTYKGVTIRNVIGKAGVGKGAIIIVGAHYDTRPRADRDAIAPNAPMPGANDGASGVAVLLELARALDQKNLKNEIWLAFFDAEDRGDLDGWEWIVGSSYMAKSLTAQPKAMILADMIGDADQQIYYDASSDPLLSKELFTIAAQLGYEKNFIPQVKYSMMDDHTPFLQRGIPSVDLIDFDYPYWHTTQDTADKLSAASLERVGRVIQAYIENGK